MIDPAVLKEILTNDGDELSFVVEWRREPDSSIYEGATSSMERLARLREFYTSVKAPVLNQLQGAGVDVEDLPASAQAIITASPQKWTRLVTSGGPLDRPALRVLPNGLFYSAAAT